MGSFRIVEIMSSLRSYYTNQTPTKTEHISAVGKTENSLSSQTFFLDQYSQIRREAEIESGMADSREVYGLLLNPFGLVVYPLTAQRT